MGHANAKSYSFATSKQIEFPCYLTLLRKAVNKLRTPSEKSNEVNFYKSSTGLTQPGQIDNTKQLSKSFIIENHLIVWFSRNLEQDQDAINQLQQFVDSIQLFSNIDEFFSFLVKLKNEKVFLIISDSFVEKLITCVHELSHIFAIYILSNDIPNDELWIEKYKKIKGVFTHMEPICRKLKHTLRLSENDIIPFEIMDSSSIVIQYLMKNILLNEINYNEKSKRDFVHFVSQQYPHELNAIKDFKQNYSPSQAIQWFTRKCFLYLIMNKAFRTHDIELIIKMGFFIRDLYHQIDQLHKDDGQKELIVYRGQCVLENELESLQANKNGFIVFNNFLCVNTNREKSMKVAYLAKNNPKLIGILFRMNINRSLKYISLDQSSYSSNHQSELLCPIYTLFRIDRIQQTNDRIWLVDLILTDNNDESLKGYFQSIKYIEGQTSWQKLGSHFIQINELDQAEKLYKTLLESNRINDSQQVALLHEQLGLIYNKKNNTIDSLLHYKIALEKYLVGLLPDDANLYSIYFNIGRLLHRHKHFDEAIENYKCALNVAFYASEIEHAKVSLVYYYIAEIYNESSLFKEAIQNYKSALDHELKVTPFQCSSIAHVYKRIGRVYHKMKDNTKSFSYYEKARQVQKQYNLPNQLTSAETSDYMEMSMNNAIESKSTK